VTTLSAGTGFESPRGLDGDSRGNLYVADAAKQSVLVFDPAGNYVAKWQGPDWFLQPVAVAVSEPTSRLYISDAGGHRIVVCDLAGHRLFSFGSQGSEPGEFRDPHGLAFDREGRLYVADTGNARIQVFEADGRFVRQFGSAGTTVNNLQKPWDVAFDQQGYLYVLDQGLRALLICQPTGQVLLATGSKSPSGGRLGFAEPTGLFIDTSDRIFISDRRNKRFAIWQFLNETYLQQHPVSEEDLSRLQKFLETQQEAAPKASS